MGNKLLIKHAGELVTASGGVKSGQSMNRLGVIKDGAVTVEDGVITRVGTTDEVLSQIDVTDYRVIDAGGKCVLPGFIDSHTHFVFGGYRMEEFYWRVSGMHYMEIMKRGGGIASTVEATRKAGKEELKRLGIERLNSMLDMGVTTVEGKSGYGLDIETEIKQLEVMKELDEEHPVDIVPTFLGAHAVPAEYRENRQKYIELLVERAIPEVGKRKLARFCDVFCEEGVFSVQESELILQTGKKWGMKPKLHADEIANTGGAELAARIGAVSADHLLKVSDEGIDMMAENGVVAALLPITAFSLREPFARARDIIDRGAAVALATDMNPGSCYSNSIPLLFALAVLYMNMTPEEAVTALTINAAAAVDMDDKIGSIETGKQGDLIIISGPSYRYIPYYIGVNTVETVVKKGKVVVNKKEGLQCW